MGDQKVIRARAKRKYEAIAAFGSMSEVALLLSIYAAEHDEEFAAWVNDSDETTAPRITADDVAVILDQMIAFTSFMGEQSAIMEARRLEMIDIMTQHREAPGLFPPNRPPMSGGYL
jgi:hypothetical protein